ncbi:MAG: dicarboxylate/amino acid:cation symporter [Gammaproteobacteria bacterium]|nr:dicarboxylate/amino acid:cation symporter [Gammaproteobacteria bacterium]
MDRGKLTRNILLGMTFGFVLGSVVHMIAPADDGMTMVYFINGLFDIGGKMFIASLKLLVVPLVFVSLVCGASNLSDGSSMGRIGIKTLGLYLITTAIAVSLALIVATTINPGEGINLAAQSEFVAKDSPSIKQVLINIVPTNPIKAMAEGNMLQVIVFAILVGVAINKCGEPGQRVRATLNDWNAVIMRLIMMLMMVAPIGVFCLMVTLFANMGFSAIADLLKYFLTVVLVLLLHFSGTFSLLIRFVANLNPIIFYKKFAPVMAYAFSMASSNATLPITLQNVEKRIGVKNEVASFTVPLGATINMDGTAIMQGVATVFISQAYNIDISMTGYLMVVLTATLASIGAAGVPGVGLITLAMVLTQVGLPVEGIALIIGVDRLLDMLRTAVNVTGDAAVSTVVARSENQFDEAVFNAEVD